MSIIPSGFCQCGCGAKTAAAEQDNPRLGWIKGEPKRFLLGHNACRTPYSALECIEEDRGFTTPCLIWQRMKTDAGYGVKDANGKRQYAHRFFYEQIHGTIPEGQTIDHLCFNRDCMNVSHMEVVSRAENSRRGALRRWHG